MLIRRQPLRIRRREIVLPSQPHVSRPCAPEPDAMAADPTVAPTATSAAAAAPRPLAGSRRGATC